METEEKPPDKEKLEDRIEGLTLDIWRLEWERDELEESVAGLVDLLRKLRVMIRAREPDLEFVELLIEREIGF